MVNTNFHLDSFMQQNCFNVSFFNLKFIFIYVHVYRCAHVCVYAHVYAGAHRGQKRESEPLVLALQVVVSQKPNFSALQEQMLLTDELFSNP